MASGLDATASRNEETWVTGACRPKRMPENSLIPISNSRPHSRSPITAGSANSSLPRKTEGAGNAGCATYPQPRAQKKSTRVSHHRSAEAIRHSLREWFNGFLRDLLGERAWLPPSQATMQSIVGRLDASVAASGPHDFAVCGWCFVRRKVLAPDTTCIHRIPRPTFVTIAKRPSWRARDAGRGASDLPDVTSENDCDKRHDGQIGAREQAAVKRDPASRTRCGVCTTATDQQSTTLHSLGALRSFREGFRRSPDQPPQARARGEKKSFIPSAAPAAVRCPGTPAWLRSARHDRRAPDGLHH